MGGDTIFVTLTHVSGDPINLRGDSIVAIQGDGDGRTAVYLVERDRYFYVRESPRRSAGLTGRHSAGGGDTPRRR